MFCLANHIVENYNFLIAFLFISFSSFSKYILECTHILYLIISLSLNLPSPFNNSQFRLPAWWGRVGGLISIVPQLYCFTSIIVSHDHCWLLFWQYQRAVAKALVDRVPDEKASTVTTVRVFSWELSVLLLMLTYSFKQLEMLSWVYF